MEENFFEQRTDLSLLNNKIEEIKKEIGKIIVGQHEMLELLLAGMLAEGHILIEGVPGVAKTLTAKLLAKTLDVQFKRIQFTPDLMPSDVIGTPVFNPKFAHFEFRNGPIFGNIILIDEINRAPAKTQSSLFEVMEEKQVTNDGTTYTMPLPFMVVATQNPVEQEGTYRLPEAQLDRFLFKINVPYPSLDEEIVILKSIQDLKGTLPVTQLNVVLTAEEIKQLQQTVKNMIAEEKILQFIAKIVHATRNNRSLFLGASPRSSIGVLTASKAIAAMRGRDFVIPDDVLYVVKPVLRHRIILTPEKEMEGITTDDVIKEITTSIEIPR
ncbi:MAG: magnesium chelatase [Chitinophaga sp.]|jgi:MoxR-like ATPase|nr:magnesium chelatase [Chitinophaga sp.]